MGAKCLRLYQLGVRHCKLFVKINDKDENASVGLISDTLIVRAIKKIKESAPLMQVMTEVCACAYSSNGECVLIDQKGAIDDRATHRFVAEMALLHAEAGADVASVAC